MTRALVVGAAGQDGSYLAGQLAADGIEVFALTRKGLSAAGAPLLALALEDRAAIRAAIGELAFDQIYYLAAHHHSAEDLDAAGELVRHSFAIHVDGLVNMLDGIVATASPACLFYAASSHVFGVVTSAPQDEETPMAPFCAYGISKAAGVRLCGYYRREHGVRASAGILYNHESPRRALKFLSRKVARAVAQIKLGRRDSLKLGNIDAQVDWGYAPEYTDAMRRILALDQGGDFVIASGRTASVRDFVAAAFQRVQLDWRDHVQADAATLHKGDRGPLVGHSARLTAMTGWSAKTSMEELAGLMVDAEMAAHGSANDPALSTECRIPP